MNCCQCDVTIAPNVIALTDCLFWRERLHAFLKNAALVILTVFQPWTDSPRGRQRLNGRSQETLVFLSLLYFPSLALFSLCNSVFLFLSTFCLSSRLYPSSFLFPLTLPSFCLTTVGLLWEVIRKNSTETHAAAAESKTFNTFYSPDLLYSKRLQVRGRGGMREGIGHL